MSLEIVQRNTETQTIFQENHANKGQYQLASRFKRWLAGLINALLFYVSLTILGVIISTGVTIGNGQLVICLGIIANIALQIWSIKTYHQTIGKRLLHLQVIDYATLEPLTLGKYMLRELLDEILNFTGIILISAIVAFFNNERRSLTDMICSTIVIRKTN